MFVLICWGSEGAENKDWTKVIQVNGKQPIILNRIILMRNILQDKVTQISAREVGFFNERRRRNFFSLCTVSTMMAEAKKSVAENFLDFLRGCSSIFGGRGVVLPERTGCQFRPPEGGSPLLPPPFVYCGVVYFTL